MPRRASVRRETRETRIEVDLDLDGTGQRDVTTPIGFFTHMLDAFGKHALVDLRLHATGDVHVDGHHTVEDTGLALGEALAGALGDKAGIARFGEASVPMDEALAQAIVDFSGRPHLEWRVEGISGKWVGEFDCDLAKEFFAALASRAGCTLHLRLHYGHNAHHIVEALFKATARAIRAASAVDPRAGGAVPSTKGTLSA